MAANKEISLFQFLDRFGNNDACIEHFKSVRWPEGVRCPYCDYDKSYIIEGGRRYKCASKKCFKKFSFTVGTIFQDTKIPLRTWYLLIYVMASNRKSISSFQLAKNLGVSQKCAWEIMHKLRVAFDEKKIPQLSGVVEVDECFIGKGKLWQRFYGSVATRKTPILGLIQRGGRVIIKTINSRSTRELEKIIFEYVKPQSTIYTDGWYAYRKLKTQYKHEWVNHSDGEYVRGDVHTNTIENVWGYFKRNIRAGHHHISGKHVQRYCNEVSWKFNNRHLTTMQRFDELLRQCLGSSRLIVEFKNMKRLRAA